MSTVQSVAQKKTMGGGRQFEINTATKSYQFVCATLIFHTSFMSVNLIPYNAQRSE